MENAGFEPSLGGAEGAELPLPAGALAKLMVRKTLIRFQMELYQICSETLETIHWQYLRRFADVPVETGVAGTVVFEPGGVVPSFATTEKTPLVLVFAVPASVNVKKYLPALTSTVHGNAFGVKLTAALMSLGVFEALSKFTNYPFVNNAYLLIQKLQGLQVLVEPLYSWTSASLFEEAEV
ncbi:3182_t:CDS:2 [Paraglomus brasilianum]|uniref:3182_t:CDS:1 n=1 Tax=Paraglomus brasilianum TaxID=144538 RepID=A0A9N9DBH9_9GLOM|nr:3182_t:CDS:2 [Paraglomus brasilianum]